MKKFNKFVSLVLAFSIFFSQFDLIAHAQSTKVKEFIHFDDIEKLAQDSVISADQNKMAQAISEFESATDASVPTKTRDIFFLARQRLEIHSEKLITNFGLSAKGKVFPLTSELAPPLLVTSFDNEVKIVKNNKAKTLTLELWRHGDHLASQVIEGLDVVASARDKEFYTFVDRSGKIYAFDTALAAYIGFRAPIPIFEVAEMDRSLINDNLDATYRTRGGLPNYEVHPGAIVPMDLAENSIFTAGSFDVYDKIQRKYVGIYSRQGLRTFVYRGEAILDLLTYAINPGEHAKRNFENLHSMAKDNEVKPLVSAYLSNIDPSLRSLIRSLPPHAVESLTKRMRQNKAFADEALDKFTSEENEKARDIISRIYKEENRINNIHDVDFGAKHREYLDKEFNKKVHKTLIERLKEPKNLKLMGLIVAGGLTVAGAYSLWNGVGPAWAVDFVHNTYDHYMTPAVKNAGYRFNALLSTASMLTFMPLVFVIGAAYSKIKTLNMDAIRASAKLGMVVWGTIMLPFFHYIAKLADQPNFIRAMQHGINPLGKVMTDRGPIRPGINVFKNDPDYSEQTQRNALIIRQIYDRRNNQKALAHAIALLVTAEQYGIDPVTLSMVQDKAYSLDALEWAATDKKFRDLWQQMAKELEATLIKLQYSVADKHFEDKDSFKNLQFDKSSNEIDQTAFELARAEARKIALQIKKRPKAINAIKSFLPSWNQVGRKLLIETSRFAVEESNYLKHADPSEFVKKQFFLQFTVDYSMSVPQITFIGARADTDHVPALAAKPDQATIEQYLSQPPKPTGNADADKENLAQWETWKNTDAREEILSRYWLWSNPQHAASMLDQVRIYAINVPAQTALVYDKFRPIIETNYQPLEEIIYQEALPRREKALESVWSFAKDIVNFKKAEYGYLWLTQITKRIKSLQATLLFTVILERIIMAGQPVDAAVLSFIFIFLTAHLKYGGIIWDPVQKGMYMRDERLEAATTKLLQAKVRLSHAIRFSQTPDKELAAAFKQFAGYYKQTKTSMPEALDTMLPEVEMFLQSTEFAMLPSFKANLKEKSAELLKHSKAKAPFATKENNLLNWGLMISASFLTTFFLMFLEVETYKTLSYAQKIANGLILFTSFYSSAYFFQKLITKWETRGQEKSEFKSAFENLERMRARSDVEAAFAYMRLGDLYKLAEKRLPSEFLELEKDLLIYIESKAPQMNKDLKSKFLETAPKLLEYTKLNPTYDGGLINKAVDAAQSTVKGFNQACSMYIKSIGSMFSTGK
ncbi:MAG: hypothetical protein IPM57_08245 [Oligoflexia bacterium]|nr:hypothetical protein [Oligoflexia bacterium]